MQIPCLLWPKFPGELSQYGGCRCRGILCWGVISTYPDSKVRGANMGPIWVLSAPDGPHVDHKNFAIRVCNVMCNRRLCHMPLFLRLFSAPRLNTAEILPLIWRHAGPSTFPNASFPQRTWSHHRKYCSLYSSISQDQDKFYSLSQTSGHQLSRQIYIWFQLIFHLVPVWFL